MTAVECCATPALQAVYDQFGALYLFWRDDPAVSDLRVPGMAEEARWRVRMAGGGLWEGLMTGEGGRVERARGMSQSSVVSDASDDSMVMGVGDAMEE
ncbi:hypothetical protein NEMBOFW57_006985 [Staphylotrichum longicolle]|uniref:Uncharacterized protein n=1 Tax=Staphylotrichum longicolle TaxID=669026 RepID=A0AAD4ETY6_9PEZI|nr:hypothetical protein NEMBOFW57_006985 [Staphylotrichum longicolle]